jgi:DNA-binding MarR family transcriptional regulator
MMDIERSAKYKREARDQDSILELNRFLPYLVVNLGKRLSAGVASTYQCDYDLSIHQWRILANLKAVGRMTAKDVGRETRMDKVKVSRALAGLLEKGWIKKEAHPDDQRAQIVSLTGPGSRVVSSIIPRALAWEADLLEVLDESERKVVMAAIAKLNARLDELSESWDGINA